jgi:hypothetical protein
MSFKTEVTSSLVVTLFFIAKYNKTIEVLDMKGK